jgi:hypothetical protein
MNLKGSERTQSLLSQYFTSRDGGTPGTSGYPAFRPRFEPSTTRIQMFRPPVPPESRCTGNPVSSAPRYGDRENQNPSAGHWTRKLRVHRQSELVRISLWNRCLWCSVLVCSCWLLCVYKQVRQCTHSVRVRRVSVFGFLADLRPPLNN